MQLASRGIVQLSCIVDAEINFGILSSGGCSQNACKFGVLLASHSFVHEMHITEFIFEVFLF